MKDASEGHVSPIGIIWSKRSGGTVSSLVWSEPATVQSNKKIPPLELDDNVKGMTGEFFPEIG